MVRKGYQIWVISAKNRVQRGNLRQRIKFVSIDWNIYIYIFSEIEYNNFSDLNGESLDRERGTEGRCSVSGAVKKQY